MTTKGINNFADKKIHGIKTSLMNLVSRFVLNKADDGKKMQEVKGELFSDEVKEELEHFQSYGFTSVPPANSEGIALSVNSNRDHVVVICLDSREYRVKNLAEGDVAVYNKSGSIIKLKASGEIEIIGAGEVKVKSPTVLKLDAPDIDLVQQNTTMNDFISTYNTHTHPETGTTTQQPNQQI